MSESFNPYRKWLGIPESERSPSHYQLLGISPEERDPDVIQAAVVRQSGYIRHFQTGKYSEEATRILNEIAAAQLCLLDSARRAAYDAQWQTAEDAPATEAPHVAESKQSRASRRSAAPVGAAPSARLAEPAFNVPWDEALPPAPAPAARPMRALAKRRSSNQLVFSLAGIAALALVVIGSVVVAIWMRGGPEPIQVAGAGTNGELGTAPIGPAPPTGSSPKVSVGVPRGAASGSGVTPLEKPPLVEPSVVPRSSPTVVPPGGLKSPASANPSSASTQGTTSNSNSVGSPAFPPDPEPSNDSPSDVGMETEPDQDTTPIDEPDIDSTEELPSLPTPKSELQPFTGKLVSSEVVGFSRGQAFKDHTPDGGILVGLRIFTGENWGGAVQAVQPIYQVGGRYVLGRRCGKEGGTLTDVIADDGYAVGGVRVSAGLVVNSLQIAFYHIGKSRLSIKDMYWADRVGSDGGSEQNLDGEGSPVTGIAGTFEEDLNSFGLEAIERPKSSAAD